MSGGGMSGSGKTGGGKTGGGKSGGGQSGGGKGGSSKGGSSKGGSSKGSGNDDGYYDFCDSCPKEQCLAAIDLQGFNFPFTVTPSSTGAKAGSTTSTIEQGLIGTVMYDDKQLDINATLTGSCTILSTNITVPVGTGGPPGAIDRCNLHCTWCLTYTGEYCEESYNHPYRALWGSDKYYEDKCCPVLGFLTMTGDLILDLQLNEQGLIEDPADQYTYYKGFFAVTGSAYDLTGAVNGGIGILQYQGPDDAFKLDVKVPFNDECACKVSESAFEYIYV
jgi:hypothetical protein